MNGLQSRKQGIMKAKPAGDEVFQQPTKKMPVLFIGHGSPMNMVLDNDFTRSLVELGKTLPKPKAIMAVSAHWLTRGAFVSCVKTPKMIYDFYGFPPELYKIKYACPGAPELSKVSAALAPEEVKCDSNWGLDHASYSILMHMFPKADIPVFEMSLNYSFNDWRHKPVGYHYELGKKFSGLRRKEVLIIGSGNLVHNLDRMRPDIYGNPYPWAEEIDEKIKSMLLKGEHDSLINYPDSGKEGSLLAPTLDHYLPMIYVLALQEEGEKIHFTYEGIQNGSISMRGFKIGNN